MSCRKSSSFFALVALLAPTLAVAQISPTHVFSPNTVISSSQVNANFALLQNALNRTGGILTGNITASAGVTIDGVDLSAWLNQAVLTTSSPTFAALTTTTTATIGSTLAVNSTGAAALDVAGGAQFGSGNVSLIDTTGKLTALSAATLASLDGTALTGLAKLATTNTFTNRNDFKLFSETRTTPAISAGALTIDLSAGTHFAVALNANATVTISNPVPSGTVGSFTIKFTADGTLRTLTWPGSVVWSGGAAPIMTSTNTKRDFITCIYDDGGTTYFCTSVPNF